MFEIHKTSDYLILITLKLLIKFVLNQNSYVNLKQITSKRNY